MSETDSAQLYQERQQRIADNVALRETERTPFVYATRFWSASLAGITFQEMMYDVDKAIDVTRQALRLLQPDGFSSSIYAFGKPLETIGYRALEWPGHGVDANSTFQYIDEEFMTAGEYDDYLFDPTGYYLRTYLPRIASAFEGLSEFPDFPSFGEWKVVTGLRAFANPQLQESLRTLFKAGEQLDAALKKIGAFVREMADEGYPSVMGGFCKAPYDHFVDSLRGSKGGMLDMFRHKDKLQAAMDKAGQFLLRRVEDEANAVGCPYIFMPLHWGLDGFMSPTQFKTYYWPGLRKIILHLIERDLVPCVLWEGNCDTRLEFIGDIPAGRAMYWFEATDMFRAKEVLGDTICLRGNVPTSLLITGTPDDVDEYCRKLIETVGKGGGFILDGAASIPDEAKLDNVAAMARSVGKYLH